MPDARAKRWRKAVWVAVLLASASSFPAFAAIDHQAVDFLHAMTQAHGILQDVLGTLPAYPNSPKPGEPRSEYESVSEAIAKIDSAAHAVNPGWTYQAVAMDPGGALTSIDSAQAELNKAITGATGDAALSKAVALLNDSKDGAIRHLTDARQASDPVLQAIGSAETLLGKAAARPSKEQTIDAAHQQSAMQAVANAERSWKSLYSGSTAQKGDESCGAGADSFTACVNKARQKLNEAVLLIQTLPKSGPASDSVSSDLKDALAALPAGTENQPPGTPSPSWPALAATLLSLGTIAVLIVILSRLPSLPERAAPERAAPESGPGEQAMFVLLQKANEARQKYDELARELAAKQAQYESRGDEIRRLREELTQSQSGSLPRAAAAAPVRISEPNDPRPGDLKPGQPRPPRNAESEAAANVLQVGEEGKKPSMKLDEPIGVSPQQQPLARPQTPPAAARNPLDDYNRAIRMNDITEAENVFRGYRTQMLSCPNLEERDNPNVVLRFESVQMGDFMAIETSGGFLVFPALNNNPLSRKTLQGVFVYRDPNAESLRLSSAARVRPAQDSGFVLDVPGEFVRDAGR